MRLSKMILWAICITVVATVALPILLPQLPLLPISPPSADMVIGCGVLVFAALLVMLACAAAIENGRAPRLMRSGIVTAIVSCVLWLGMIMLQPPWEILLALQRVIVWPTAWAVLMMIVALLLLPKAHHIWWARLRIGAIVTVAVFAAFVCMAVTFHPEHGSYSDYAATRQYEDGAVRIGAGLALIASAAVVITLLGAALARFGGELPRELVQLPYWLRCPRCQHEQNAITGTHHCSSCGLKVRVEVS